MTLNLNDIKYNEFLNNRISNTTYAMIYNLFGKNSISNNYKKRISNINKSDKNKHLINNSISNYEENSEDICLNCNSKRINSENICLNLICLDYNIPCFLLEVEYPFDKHLWRITMESYINLKTMCEKLIENQN